jgi:pilus assembly protein Flp/PilA
MQKIALWVRKLFVREEGATMVEYGLMVALIAVVCIAAVTLLGSSIQAVFNNIAGMV